MEELLAKNYERWNRIIEGESQRIKQTLRERNMERLNDYGQRFVPELTIPDLVKNYDRWTQMLEDESRRIRQSTIERKFLILNIKTADPWELLATACSCIYNMTGDTYFDRFTKEVIEERRKETYGQS